MNWSRLTNPSFLTALLLLAAAAVALPPTLSFMDIHLRKLPIEAPGGLRFHTLPTEVPGWRRYMDPPPMSREVIQQLGTENYISRYYIETDPPDGREPHIIELHCAYYTGMIDAVPHVPERCFVAGGITIAGSSQVVRVPIDLDRFPPDPDVNREKHGEIRRGRTDAGLRVRMPRNIENLRMMITPFTDQSGRRVYAGYFFIANGGTVAGANEVRLLAFRHQDTYAYYAKVQLMSVQASSAQELAEIAASFLNEMLPEIMRRTPDWIDVLEGRYPSTDQAGSESLSLGEPIEQFDRRATRRHVM